MSANQTIVRRFFDEVCNGRKLQVAEELFTVNHAYHDPAHPGADPGPEGMKQLMSLYHTGFPDGHWQLDEMLEAGDTVITRFTGSGTHNGDLQGIAPTGKRVTVTGIWIHRIAGGKVAESWNVWDTLGMLQQIGVVPVFTQAKHA